MSATEVLEQAMQLQPQEQSFIVESLLKTLNQPSQELESIWTQEAQERLAAYRSGRLQSAPMEELFND